MSDILIRTQHYRWTCPECGDVEDRSVEVTVDKRPVGRWFEDGHQGLSRIDDNEVEYRLWERLELPFWLLESIRSRRSQLRLKQALPVATLGLEDFELFDQSLRNAGHPVTRVHDWLEVRAGLSEA